MHACFMEKIKSANLWHLAIQRALGRFECRKVLEDAGVCDMHADGSLIVAKAILYAVGRGHLVRATCDDKGILRYGALVDQPVYDASGYHDSVQHWLRHVKASTPSTTCKRMMFCYGIDFGCDWPEDNHASIIIAKAIYECGQEALRDQLIAAAK